MKRILLFPQRFTAWLAGNNGRAFKVILMILVFITALYTKEYKGQHQHIINANIGGILYVLFGSLLFSALFMRLKPFAAVLLSLGITCLLEFLQYLRLPFMVEITRQKAMAYLFGSSFNPVDFIYYGIGGLVALGLLFMLKHKTIAAQEISRSAETADNHVHSRKEKKLSQIMHIFE